MAPPANLPDEPRGAAALPDRGDATDSSLPTILKLPQFSSSRVAVYLLMLRKAADWLIWLLIIGTAIFVLAYYGGLLKHSA